MDFFNCHAIHGDFLAANWIFSIATPFMAWIVYDISIYRALAHNSNDVVKTPKKYRDRFPRHECRG
jgi:hypothetical protein